MAGLLMASTNSAVAQTDVIIVQLDQAKVLQLPDKTSTVIVGNPIIADVTMLKRGNRMVITGKGFGQTNLIALDSAGNSIGESVIQVIKGSAGLVLQRGMERESYNCAPICQPTVALGDSGKYLGEVAGQIQSRNSASAPGGK
jgi:Flp pilus assembly secretin CpaC